MVRWVVMVWASLSGAALAAEIPQAMAQAEVVFLGEVHDNPHIHMRQAELVRALRPRAVVFEMLTPGQAARATPDLSGDATALEAALQWADAGWPDFAMYYPIFEAAGAAEIFGAAVPRAAARAAMEKGVPESFGDGAERFGLTTPLPDDEQAARETVQHMAHCEALPGEMLPVMVDLQRLRDAVLARAVLQALEATGGPVVVITGNGHARKDWGAPNALARAQPGVTVFSLGLSEAGEDKGAEFDRVEQFPRVERDDPCAVFKDK
jgi:uncharacterized iron-regulated protein